MIIRRGCMQGRRKNVALPCCGKSINDFSSAKGFTVHVRKDSNPYSNIIDIRSEDELNSFFLAYNKNNLTEVFNDYAYLVNSNLRGKCSKSEIEECLKITKYLGKEVALINFVKTKGCAKTVKNSSLGSDGGCANRGGPSEHRSSVNNVYYIHNIERGKVNREELLKSSENNVCLRLLLGDNLYRFISKIKKCDVWNFKEKNVNTIYTNYRMLFPIMHMNMTRKRSTSQMCNCHCDSTIFLNYIQKKNKDIFLDIIKKVNYKMLTSQEMYNVLIVLTVLHHNNISLSFEKNNIIKSTSSKDVIYKNKEYVNKKLFVDIFTNMYKSIFAKINSISFLYLYDYLLLFCVNEVKNKELYINIVNRLSQYVNLLNKINNNTGGVTQDGDSYLDTQQRITNSINLGPCIPESDTSICAEDGDMNGGENRHGHSALPSAESKETCVLGEDGERIDYELGGDGLGDGLRNGLRVSRQNYLRMKSNMLPLKNAIIAKIQLLYIMKYVFNHIDSNVLYAHSDLICENLELIPHYMVTNFIFTIGTCKYIDEFCMFMLAKYVQNNINVYTPNEITIIVNTYADASLEDVSFYETICDHVKRNFTKFTSIDIIKTMYAFSKVRIRDIDLLNMSYKKINDYLEERERQFNINTQLKELYWENEMTHLGSNTLSCASPIGGSTSLCTDREGSQKDGDLQKSKEKGKKNKYVINKYLCAYALIAAGKLDYFDELNKLFVHLKESIKKEGIDIRGILWMPIAITSFLSSECLFNFLPIYVNLIYHAFKKTQSPKLLSLLIRRHSILLHSIETDIIPKKYIPKNTLKNLYFICKSKKDNSKEKVFVPDSSTFHIEVSNALLSLDIPHKKEVNIYPFTIDIFIKTSENSDQTILSNTFTQDNVTLSGGMKKKKKKMLIYDEDTNFEHTFEKKKVKNKAKNKNEVYTDVPFT
ncbi:conserved Plasmodium protein, unknown function [Plasmodium ovale]|uniref:Uncharacterized protein n=1 Tax=Plasmodium ovale TaxID=36330 RepID=A0A1C3KQQ7_PLAOA|nr:conserved Plasmodium protein, unknown function [Plasmodium ovale]